MYSNSLQLSVKLNQPLATSAQAPMGLRELIIDVISDIEVVDDIINNIKEEHISRIRCGDG